MQPSPRRRETELIREVGRTVKSYVRGQLLVMLLMMILYSVGFYVVEVPLWLLAGFLCGLFHLVPIVGGVLGAFIPIAFALFAGGGLGQVFRILVVFVLVQAVESLYLTPKILGAELSLRPLVVFLAVLIGGLVFGAIGALIAAPVVAVGMLVWKRVRWSTRVLGNKPPRD